MDDSDAKTVTGANEVEAITLPGGRRVLVVDSVGKPVKLPRGVVIDLERQIITLPEPLKVGDEVRIVEPPDIEALKEQLEVAAFKLEKKERKHKPKGPPKPRRSKRERRGDWRR